MVFSSLIFLLLFLPLTIALYFLSPPRFRNGLLCTASLLFYLTGSGSQIFLLLFTATVDYLIGWRIYLSPRKKCWLWLSIAFNLSFLAYFKYANFLAGNWNSLVELLHLPLRIPAWQEVVLPLGISFYTFETMAYVIDIYMGRQKPARSILDYALYITLFPHLIAGPIYRFAEIDHEIDPLARSKANSADQIFLGLYIFCMGLAKKVVLANSLGKVADYCFGQPLPSKSEAWLGALSYTFQIYFDFSGYSEMAVGLGMIFGFHLPKNFDRPYTARSITEFWRRWHMTLSRWFRDYLYIPLGGNRGSRMQTFRNLLLVFLLCGLWHGASWNFVFWGLYHGALLVLERAGLGSLLERLPRPVAQAYTFLLTIIGWVLFRTGSWFHALVYLCAMFVPAISVPTSMTFYQLTRSDWEFPLVFAVASLSLFKLGSKRLSRNWPATFTLLRAGIICTVCAYTLGALATGTFNPFLYFRF